MTFRRMADRRPVETLVERDDGVTFAMRGAGGGGQLPHDLVHAVVEEQLGVPDGIWGCVADGVIWRSMTRLSGCPPPHATERSDRLKRERATSIRRAEAVADLVGRLASDAEVLPGELAGSGVPRNALTAAVAELRKVQRLWTALAVGDVWVIEWNAVPRASARHVADPGRRRSTRSGRP